MADARTEPARRLAALALHRAQPAARTRGGIGALSALRRPLSRRAADLAVLELIDAAKHDRNALLRAAQLLERGSQASQDPRVAEVAHDLLVEAVAAVTTR